MKPTYLDRRRDGLRQQLDALPYAVCSDGGHAAFCFIAAVLMASCSSWPAGP